VLLEEPPPRRPGLSTRWGMLLISASKPPIWTAARERDRRGGSRPA